MTGPPDLLPRSAVGSLWMHIALMALAQTKIPIRGLLALLVRPLKWALPLAVCARPAVLRERFSQPCEARAAGSRATEGHAARQ
jgi:hypothetical protein